jgi:hypothetical protein
MTYQINPAFHRHVNEAAIVGRLLSAFGELEYMMVTTTGKAAKNLPDS